MAVTFGAGLLACVQLLQHRLLPCGLAGSLTGSVTECLAKRDDWWNWGLLAALAGQFLLFTGFALRRARRRSRPTSVAGGKNRSHSTQGPTPTRQFSPLGPPWSARCEAALGLSLDGD